MLNSCPKPTGPAMGHPWALKLHEPLPRTPPRRQPGLPPRPRGCPCGCPCGCPRVAVPFPSQCPPGPPPASMWQPGPLWPEFKPLPPAEPPVTPMDRLLPCCSAPSCPSRGASSAEKTEAGVGLAGRTTGCKAWGGLRTWVAASPQRAVCHTPEPRCGGPRCSWTLWRAQHPQSLASLAAGPLRSHLMVSVTCLPRGRKGCGVWSRALSPQPAGRTGPWCWACPAWAQSLGQGPTRCLLWA